MSIGIRGFTIGYDFYATERSICFHHYANGKNKAKRGKVKTFWEHANKYAGTGKKAMKRLCVGSERLLGIGNVAKDFPDAVFETCSSSRCEELPATFVKQHRK